MADTARRAEQTTADQYGIAFEMGRALARPDFVRHDTVTALGTGLTLLGLELPQDVEGYAQYEHAYGEDAWPVTPYGPFFDHSVRTLVSGLWLRDSAVDEKPELVDRADVTARALNVAFSGAQNYGASMRHMRRIARGEILRAIAPIESKSSIADRKDISYLQCIMDAGKFGNMATKIAALRRDFAFGREYGHSSNEVDQLLSNQPPSWPA